MRAPPVSDSHQEADDRPDRAIVHLRDRAGADEPLHLVARANAAPPGDPAVDVGEHARSCRALHLIAECLLPRCATRTLTPPYCHGVYP